MPNYYVSQWALRRRAEMVDVPADFDIHPDYLRVLDKERIVAALRRVRQTFGDVFQDIADHPESFKMPLVEIRSDNLTTYGFPPPEAASSRRAPFMFFDALINVLISGDLGDGELAVDPEKLKVANKHYKMHEYRGYSPKSYAIRNVDRLYAQFDRYGLYLEGMNTDYVILRYPDSPDALTVLKWMADKAHEHDRRQDFVTCHYRLFQDDMGSLRYGTGVDYIADKMHTGAEADCAYRLDEAIRDEGLTPNVDNCGEPSGEDGYAVYYYAGEKDVGNRSKSNVKLASRRCKLYLLLRIRDIQSCAEHVGNCSEDLRRVFREGDQGCSRRLEGACRAGQAYTFEGKDNWKCGCGGMQFTFQPRAEDIADYVRLIALGNRV